MKLDGILKILEEVAPVALSDSFCKKYGMYDNSGIIVDCGGEITGALFSLDLSENALKAAKDAGFNLIITHHPAIYGGISRLKSGDPIYECVRNGVSVISMHLNFDVAPRGIDYYLMRGLGGENPEILADVEGGGYGRVYEINERSFAEYAEAVKKTFSARALAYGAERQIKKIASFCGAGYDGNALEFACAHKADVFVSSDLKHHEITGLLQRGMNVIHLTHYSAENYGFNKIYRDIKNKLGIGSEYFTDPELI